MDTKHELHLARLRLEAMLWHYTIRAGLFMLSRVGNRLNELAKRERRAKGVDDISTARGEDLDRIGAQIGVPRREQH